jgi:hypothetical protein
MRLLWILALAGCGGSLSQQLIEVTDEDGRPVAEAEVWARGDSMNAGPHVTDLQGRATAPASGTLAARGYAVKAKGFELLRVDAPAAWPLRITLRRERWDYEFLATLVGFGYMSDLPEGSRVLTTAGGELNWYVEFHVRAVVSGRGPTRPTASILYAIHSPSGILGGRKGGDVRVRGRLIDFGGEKRHDLRLVDP